MRQTICLGNLFAAALSVVVSMLSLLGYVHDQPRGSPLPVLGGMAAAAVWIVFANRIFQAGRLWSRLASAAVAAGLAVYFGVAAGKYIGLSWRAEHGDRTVELDPTTVGIPLVCSVLATLVFLLLFAGLLSLPIWEGKENENPAGSRRRSGSEAGQPGDPRTKRVRIRRRRASR